MKLQELLTISLLVMNVWLLLSTWRATKRNARDARGEFIRDYAIAALELPDRKLYNVLSAAEHVWEESVKR